MEMTKMKDVPKRFFNKRNGPNTLLGIAGWVSLIFGVILFSLGVWTNLHREGGPLTASYRDDTVYVEAMYGKEARIPKDAELRAWQMTPEADPEMYSQNMASAMAAMGRDGEEVPTNAIYNVGFYVGDQEVEPAAPVNVTVQILKDGFAAGEPIKVVHLGENDAEVIADTSVDDAGFVSFTTDGFSDFVVVSSGSGEEPGISLMSLTPPGEPGDMTGLLDGVTITDDKGAEVEEGGTLYVGEKYTIHLTFKESGVQGNKQFSWTDPDCTMTYQIPSKFEIVKEYKDVELKVTIEGQEVVIGHYSITKDGMLTFKLTGEGKAALETANNITLDFNMQAMAQAGDGDDDGKVHFGGDGKEFEFKIVDQPRVDVDKQGRYAENADGKGGKLEYTVTTKVEHGEASNLEILDVLTPPESPAFSVEVKPEDIKVTVKRANGEGEPVVLEKGKDYELAEVPDADHPGKKTFKIKFMEGSEYATLKEGDELDITYHYGVQYVEGSTDLFWGNVGNDVTVTGKGTVPLKDPGEGEVPTEIPIEDHKSSNVELYVIPPGNGVVFKYQEFSETNHTLHYTLYTLVPRGTWTPCYIQDDMVVEVGGEKYYIPEFKKGGRVSELKVSALQLEGNYFDSWGTSSDLDKLDNLEKLKGMATSLGDGFDFDAFPDESGSQLPEGYSSQNMDQWVYRLGGTTLNIIFGFEGGKIGNYWEKWGHWNRTDKDTLIITEYDLNMADDAGGDITLQKMGDTGTTIEKKASEILTAGITNNVNLRFQNWYPGYTVFFNNIDRMNKTGKPNKSDDTIDYTVTLNTTDTTVLKYFRDVTKNWLEETTHEGVGWSKNAYEQSMRAVFYDKLPGGWTYVPDSLYASTTDKWGNVTNWKYTNPGDFLETNEEQTEINAPLVFFKNVDESAKNQDMFNTFAGGSLAQLTFTYKLKATDEWLKEHLTGTEGDNVVLDNHAEIKDSKNTQPHWTADEYTPYLPQYLTKEAVQVGKTNLLQFTLHINRGGIDLDPEKNYLLVNDASENLDVDKYSIQVLNESGEALKRIEDPTIGDNLPKDQWVLMPSTESGKFQLMVPDGVALTIKYDAQIPQLGKDVQVSNKASVDSVNRTDSSYDRSLAVEEINASGTGSLYSLTIEKTDSKNGKKLSGAEFKFYLVSTGGLAGTEQITIGEKKYDCYTEDKWLVETGKDGTFEISKDMNWRLEPKNYYILVETQAPDGYEKLEDPILFYFGFKDEIDKDNYPTDLYVVPGGKVPLIIADSPVEYNLPETGGPGTLFYVITGFTLVLGSGILLIVRRRLRQAR